MPGTPTVRRNPCDSTLAIFASEDRGEGIKETSRSAWAP